jgi:hypothetical protein
LILDFEFDQHLESHKHVISIIMGFRDTGCYIASTGILLSRLVVSAWWVSVGHPLTTVPPDTQPLGDLKHPMHGHPATELSITSIQTSMMYSSKLSWSRSNA